MNDNQLKLEKALSDSPDNVRASLIYGQRLSECSTFKIGGKADCVAYPRNEEELTAVCNAARPGRSTCICSGKCKQYTV